MRRQVIASLKVEGIHSWPKCPHEEVSFLKSKHRHIFHIKAWKSVEHNDRDTEIILMRRDILRSLFENHSNTFDGCFQFGTMSCEDIAEFLLTENSLDSVEVMEDGENGAVLWNK